MTSVNLNGKRILITGAARGLGFAFAQAAVAAGARVAIADVLEDRGRASARESGAEFVALDLAQPASIKACANAAASKLGGLDGLVNNGAIATGIGGPLIDKIEIEIWDKVMTVNVRGTWLMTCAALPFLKKSGSGRVVNVASDTALWGAPRLMHYVASKGAIISMTRSMARELGDFGIAVNAIAPGLTLVEATEYVPKDRHDQYVNGRAMHRAQMPEDVCGAVMFFLSDAAGFVTGQLLPVNGGFVMN
ncbi:MAG: SDR family oxidoreductase [Betaproteobacteria bacterium]|nr:SDR family oxidoreductase [Betaproteobacteria bacterium]